MQGVRAFSEGDIDLSGSRRKEQQNHCLYLKSTQNLESEVLPTTLLKVSMSAAASTNHGGVGDSAGKRETIVSLSCMNESVVNRAVTSIVSLPLLASM